MTFPNRLGRRMLLLAGLLWLGAAALPGRADGFDPSDLEYFESRVRPLLAEHCLRCHSRAEEKQKGGLYLDSREDLLAGGETRPAVVPGDPEASLLIEAVRYQNQDLQMPPKTRLPAEAVAVLEEWVRRGAAWPATAVARPPSGGGFDLAARRETHWCWQPPVDVPPPRVPGAEDLDPIDRFLLAGLNQRGLQAAPEAGKPTLLRRVTLDLIGLPPTPAELDAFLADDSPDAYERVVDRLLASPHFGERWARHWLDLVRWAETRGHEFDPDIPNAWRYRDYVVRAFNADLPHDRFVREHIAGDLIPPRRDPVTGANESILGTGFWFLGEEVHSPVDIRQDESDRLDNRLDVMGKAFLGLTISCARCHDHKFDAISQRDYYALLGYLAGSSYRQVRYETLESEAAAAARLEEWRAAHVPDVLRALGRAVLPGLQSAAGSALAALGSGASRTNPPPTDTWAAALAAAAADPSNPWHPLTGDARAVGSEPAAEPAPAAFVLDFTGPDAGAWRQDGNSFGTRPRHAGEVLWTAEPGRVLAGVAPWASMWRDPAWPELEVVESGRDAGRLGGWMRSGQTLRTADFDLDAPRLWYLVRGAGRAYAVVNSHLIVNGPLHGALLCEWDAPAGGWAWIPHPLGDYLGHRLHVEFSPRDTRDFAVAAVVQADVPPPLPGPGRARPEGLDPAATARWIVDGLVRVADRMARDGEVPAADPGDAARADWLVRHLDLLCPPGTPARVAHDTAVDPVAREHRTLLAAVPRASRTAPAMFDGPGVDEHVLKRGSTRLPGDLAPRRFLEAIDGPDPAPIRSGSGRLELADRIADPSNPLTARVAVNRIWHHLFGRGLVATTDNFGLLGEAPSHPELLDHLALRFTGPLGGSTKRLVRALVLTRAYRRSSAPGDPATESADPDNVFLHRMNLRRLEAEAIRDSLLSVAGRLDPKMGGPGVPVHLTPFMEGRGRPERSGPADGAGRRSLYLELRRNFLPPMLLAFDLPIPFNAVGRRNVSNVPSQALILMNDPFVAELARHWAARLPSDATPGQRVSSMYRTAFARDPDPGELDAALAFLDGRTSGNERSEDAGAWADLAHVLFNVKEFIYRN